MEKLIEFVKSKPLLNRAARLIRALCIYLLIPCIGALVVVALFSSVNFEQSASTPSLSKSSAKKACTGSWQKSSVMAYKGDLNYEQTLIAKTGENQYNVIIHYTFNGHPESYPCDVFLRNGKTMVTTYK